METIKLTRARAGRDPQLLASLVSSLDNFDSVRKKTSDPVPECVRDYASENVVHRAEPDGVGTKAVSIPVRMIVATDGSVKLVHVIRASGAQRRNIKEAPCVSGNSDPMSSRDERSRSKPA